MKFDTVMGISFRNSVHVMSPRVVEKVTVGFACTCAWISAQQSVWIGAQRITAGTSRRLADKQARRGGNVCRLGCEG